MTQPNTVCSAQYIGREISQRFVNQKLRFKTNLYEIKREHIIKILLVEYLDTFLTKHKSINNPVFWKRYMHLIEDIAQRQGAGSLGTALDRFAYLAGPMTGPMCILARTLPGW